MSTDHGLVDEPELQTAQDALLRRRDGIYAAQAQLERDVIEVNRLINAAAPVHRLPLELIIDIFLRIYHTLFATPDAPGMVSAWLQIASACRYWREIILSTPAFWRYIKVGAAPEWLMVSLDYARDGPTEIRFRDCSGFPWHQLLMIMQFSTPPVRLISFVDLNGQEAESSLGLLFILPFPSLSTLHIACDASTSRTSISLPRRRNLPNLTSLALHHLGLTRCDLALFTNLLHLELDDCTWTSTPARFQSVLAQSPRLETLVLRCCLSKAFGRASEPNADTTPIVLARLRTLRLERNPIAATARALERLSLPNATSVSITADLGGLYEDEIDETIPNMLPMDLGTLFPALATVHSVDMEVAEEYCLRLRNRDGVCITFGLYSTAADPWEDSDSTALGVSDLLHVCHGLPVRSLHLRGNWDAVWEDEWRRVFTAFPLLDDITLKGHGEATYFFDGLGAACVAQPEGECCPALRTISLDGLHGSPSWINFERVITALRERTNRGHSQLEALHLHLEYLTGKVAQYDAHYAEYFDRLAMLARDVSFTYCLRTPLYGGDSD